jgi:hypothetical protein
MNAPAPLIASEDGERLPLGANLYLLSAAQLYADSGNQGKVWIGGPDIAAEMGIPMKPGATNFVQGRGGSAGLNSWCLYFEKAGDKVYRLFY